jgi:hypothetical protein
MGANPDPGTPQRIPKSWEEDNVQPVTGSGQTPTTAAQHSTPAVVDLLISHGASLENARPLHSAVTSPWLDASERMEMMDHLVQNLGIDVNAKGHVLGSQYGLGTALHGAAVWFVSLSATKCITELTLTIGEDFLKLSGS